MPQEGGGLGRARMLQDPKVPDEAPACVEETVARKSDFASFWLSYSLIAFIRYFEARCWPTAQINRGVTTGELFHIGA